MAISFLCNEEVLSQVQTCFVFSCVGARKWPRKGANTTVFLVRNVDLYVNKPDVFFLFFFYLWEYYAHNNIKSPRPYFLAIFKFSF